MDGSGTCLRLDLQSHDVTPGTCPADFLETERFKRRHEPHEAVTRPVGIDRAGLYDGGASPPR